MDQFGQAAGALIHRWARTLPPAFSLPMALGYLRNCSEFTETEAENPQAFPEPDPRSENLPWAPENCLLPASVLPPRVDLHFGS